MDGVRGDGRAALGERGDDDLQAALRLAVCVGRQLLAAGRGLVGRESAVLPFTQAGYEEFLQRARRTEGTTWGVLDETARVWWGRAIPRGLLVVEEAPAEPAPAAAPPVSP